MSVRRRVPVEPVYERERNTTFPPREVPHAYAVGTDPDGAEFGQQPANARLDNLDQIQHRPQPHMRRRFVPNGHVTHDTMEPVTDAGGVEEAIRDAVEQRLTHEHFWEPVAIEGVTLETGGDGRTVLVVVLRRELHPDTTYRLTMLVPDEDPEGAAFTVTDRVMEVVDADPGLPPPLPGQAGSVWISLD